MAVEEPPHRLVGDTEPRRAVHRPADAEQPEVVQQGEEVLAPVEPFQGEAHLYVAVRRALADEAPEQVEVAVELFRALAGLPIHQQQMAELAVVDAHVGVDEVVRHGLVRHGLGQEVQHHVGVVHGALGALGEPVAVVPLAHHVERGVHVVIESAAPPVRLQEASHLRLGEAEHGVELGPQADVATDVEAAGHVVQGDGRDAGHEQALEAAHSSCASLEGGEEVAVEPPAVGEGVVCLGAAVREHRVGEVVVLVDEDVQGDVELRGVIEELSELAVDGLRGQDAPGRRLGEQVHVPLQRSP